MGACGMKESNLFLHLQVRYKNPEIYYYYNTGLLYYQIQELKYKQITFVRELESKEETVFQ